MTHEQRNRVSFEFVLRQIDALHTNVNDVRRSMINLQSRFDGMDARFGAMEGRFAGLEARFASMEQATRAGFERVEAMLQTLLDRSDGTIA